MKLIQQVSLYFRDGNSDKVYEVDLCEVGDNQYVVNFRYGRRSTNLKDGTKTVLPVPRAEAESIFEKLVASKKQKGYQDREGGPVGATPPPQRTSRSTGADARRKAQADAILGRLRDPDEDEASQWPLERIIWRAGELRVERAVPLLVSYVGTGGDLRDYCVAWALGRIGDAAAIGPLTRMHGNAKHSEAVRRMAAEALLAVSTDEMRRSFLSEVQLSLAAHLEREHPEPHTVTDRLYLLATENAGIRKDLLEFVRTAALAPGPFRRLRHIFKAAEFRQDGEFFGILAHRFEKTDAKFGSYGGYGYANAGGRWVEIQKEIVKPDSGLAYSRNTRTYLRLRVWRTLRRLGREGDPAYVKMAVGVLLPFTDDDAEPPRQHQSYDWESRRTSTVHYDAFAAYPAFNYLLYANSPRYEPQRNGRAWRCKAPFVPGGPAPGVREEAFPEVWDREPRGLLHLLSDSACASVHVFAVRALRANPSFCEGLETAVLRMLLRRPYAPTASLGLEFARKRYDPHSPDMDLVDALLDADLEDARRLAREWIDASPSFFLKDAGFVLRLVASRHADVRAWSRGILVASAQVTPAQAETLIVRAVALLLALDPDDPANGPLASDVGDTLLKAFAQALSQIGLDVVRDLLNHRLKEVQAFAGHILLSHRIRPEDLPDDLLQALLAADAPEVRGLGVRLWGELPDAMLLNRKEAFVAFCLSALPEARRMVRPVIARVAAAHSDFALALLTELIPHLLHKERHPGLHADLLQTLEQDLAPGHALIDRETTWWLLHARAKAANQLGALLLQKTLKAEELSVGQMAKLASHEARGVRETSWRMYRESLPRLKADMDKAVGILDAKWDDSREFAFEFFRQNFGREDWTPGVLVGICDSVRPDVQRFGRDLVTRFFEDADGHEYLLKLSQHPSPDVQLFATNYLERFAAGRPDRLEDLYPYFVSVLSQVNRGRVAKNRVFLFLASEAGKSEAAARIVARLFSRLSATMAISDKAACIQAMRDIKRVYADIEMPIALPKVPTRSPLRRAEGRDAI